VNRYELLLFLHIAASILWLGSAFFLQALVFRAQQTEDRALMKSLGDSSEWFARTIFIPVSLSVLVLGVLLVLDGPWEFDDVWVALGVLGYLASFFTGLLLVAPEGNRIGATIAAKGPAHPDVARRIRKINIISRVELIILFLVVADMTLKPTDDDTGTLLALGGIAAVAIALGVVAIRSAGPIAEAARPAE
jgi:uncharacterized membrane protein